MPEVETAMRRTTQRHHALRLRAIRAQVAGTARAEVALFCNVTEGTVLSAIRALNQGGIDALPDKARRGRPRLLTAERFRDEVVPLLENPTAAGQQHWTAVKLHGHPAGNLQTGAHVRLSVIGAVEPASGACSALICDGCDTAGFQPFLDTLAA